MTNLLPPNWIVSWWYAYLANYYTESEVIEVVHHVTRGRVLTSLLCSSG